MSERTWMRRCLQIPLLLLIGAYLWLAVDHGKWWLGDVVVHESGRYTWWQTVFYFSHFLREIPTDVAMALFLGVGGIAGARPRESAKLPVLLLGAALTVSLAAILATAGAQGWDSAMLDLLQYRTRDNLVEYGSHWRYHWLSTLWFGLLVSLANQATNGSARRIAIVPWLYFAVMTAIFGLDGRVFTDVRYAGHQAREILTHAPVTFLLGMGIRSWWATRDGARQISFRPVSSGRLYALAGPVLAIPCYLAAVTMTGDFRHEGQSEMGLSAMVAGHYFEHALDYLLVILLVIPCSELIRRRQEERAPCANG